jgi:hypothetical protein
MKFREHREMVLAWMKTGVLIGLSEEYQMVVWYFLMWEDQRLKAWIHPRKMFLHLSCGHASLLVILCCSFPNTVQVHHLIWVVFLKAHDFELWLLESASHHSAEAVWKDVDHGERMVEGSLLVWEECCAQKEMLMACCILIRDCRPFFLGIFVPYLDLIQS